MNSLVKIWLRRAGLTLTILLVTAVLLVTIIVATEPGTRWSLMRVASLTPLQIDAEEVSGTWLSGIEVAALGFDNDDIALAVDNFALNFDWSGSSLRGLAFDAMRVAAIDIRTSPPVEREPEPLQVSMPELPLWIAVHELSIDSLAFNDLAVSAITARELRAVGTRIDVEYAGATVDRASIEVRSVSTIVDGDVPLSGTIDWRIADTEFSGRVEVGGSLRRLGVQHELRGQYPARTEGSVQLLGRVLPIVDLTTAFDRLAYGDWEATAGRVSIQGTLSEYRLDVEVSVANGVDPTALAAHIEGSAAGDDQGMRDIDVDASIRSARVLATGSARWAPEQAADLTLAVRNFDPSEFLTEYSGAIDGDFHLTANSVEQFAVDITALSGTWNRQTADARGRLTRLADSWQCRGCRLAVGENTVAVDGQLDGLALSGKIDIDAPHLAALWPELAGSVEGTGTVGGSLTLPRLSGRVAGSGLAFAGWQVGSLSAISKNSSLDSVDATVTIDNLQRGSSRFGGGSLYAVGKLDSVHVSADWSRDELAASVEAEFAITAETVSGRVTTARLTEPLNGTWETPGPFQFSAAADRVQVDNAQLANGDARLRLVRFESAGGDLDVEASLQNLDLDTLNTLLPDTAEIGGLADAAVDVTRSGDGWSGTLDWSQSGTRLRLKSAPQEIHELQLPLAKASVSLDTNAVNLRAELGSDSGHRAELDLSLDELSMEATMEARLRFGGDDWVFVPQIIPEIENVEGVVTADLTATGPIGAPKLDGELRWREGALAIPALNLPLTAIDITLTGTSAGDMNLSGGAASGDGTLSITGQVDDIASATPAFAVTVEGEGATLLNWADYRLIASPQLVFSGDGAGVQVTGKINVDQADIKVKGLPEGAVKPSDDVIVSGREPEARKRTRVSAEVELFLGDNMHVSAFGLETDLEGELRFVVADSREPQGFGEVRLAGGVFEAFGQRLEIEQGTMIFTGPLDDPLVNVRAVRIIDDIDGTVTAGLNVTGRAQNLRSSVFSNPSMAEAEALSWLVLGRPLDQASTADTNSLTNTAYSLGMRQATVITNQIGQSAGLDELSVSGNNQNTTSLVAGKQLNSRLYARYAYGVFTKLGRLLLRYRLSDSLAIELGAGETQSIDVLYIIERE